MAEKKRGLGRGLGALIPITEPQGGVMEVPIADLQPNPNQPRRGYDQEALSQLADSIRENGVIQPLIVSATPRGYEIIAGERRWQAAKLAGKATVPVLIREASPRDGLILALVENLQREDLNPLEAATAYRELVERFSLSQEDVAKRVGKSQAAVANSLRLFKLADAAKRALSSGEISEGHARAILSLEGQAVQMRALQRIMRGGLSVRQTEELVRRMRGEGPIRKKPGRTLDSHTQTLEQRFREALGTKVQLFRSKRGGKLVVYFFSEEELDGLYRRLVKQ
ncbi:MAG: ParB/RepB/Spo0J family partition protein [Chloroflexi bacterium]|nr:ParB/RepB/Spo0J family partition protein [Chloroflexota bacterium]